MVISYSFRDLRCYKGIHVIIIIRFWENNVLGQKF